MNLTYTTRLLCLCCASFFMIHLALAMAARLGAGTAVRMAEHMKPSSAAVYAWLRWCSPYLR
jgi:Mn2+/Fe2+ NRAMP family transporter